MFSSSFFLFFSLFLSPLFLVHSVRRLRFFHFIQTRMSLSSRRHFAACFKATKARTRDYEIAHRGGIVSLRTRSWFRAAACAVNPACFRMVFLAPNCPWKPALFAPVVHDGLLTIGAKLGACRSLASKSHICILIEFPFTHKSSFTIR